MNCLWCRGTVGKIPSFRSPDFCCSRCEHRFYSTGHKLDEDREREERLASESQRRSNQLRWIEEDLNKIRETHEQVVKEREAAKGLNILTALYFLLGSAMFVVAVMLYA